MEPISSELAARFRLLGPTSAARKAHLRTLRRVRDFAGNALSGAMQNAGSRGDGPPDALDVREQSARRPWRRAFPSLEHTSRKIEHG